MNSNWQPNQEVYEVLSMGGISKEFSNKLQEFKIYWGEKGLLKDNWNSIFVDFVRREWVKENHLIRALQPKCIEIGNQAVMPMRFLS